jgi:hypothetical protein
MLAIAACSACLDPARASLLMMFTRDRPVALSATGRGGLN